MVMMSGMRMKVTVVSLQEATSMKRRTSSACKRGRGVGGGVGEEGGRAR
jgi:hypothetical protein